MYFLEITPRVHQVTDRRANIFIIAEKKLTLIDAGFPGSGSYVLECIRKIGRSPSEIELVIVTHNHPDHTGSIGELRQVADFKIAAHADEFVYSNRLPHPADNLFGQLMQNQLFARVRQHILLKKNLVDIDLNDNQVLPVLDGLRVIATPGHTPGSISLYAPQPKILFVGDALGKQQNQLRLPYRAISSNHRQAIESVRRMAELDVQILAFGHGHPITENAGAALNLLASRFNPA